MSSRSLVHRSAALTLAAAAVVTCAVPASAEADTTARALTTLVEQDVRAGAPGVVVRITGPGRTVAIERQAAWTTAGHRLAGDDQFRMASNTKTMVATVALQLVAEHRLSLADPVEKWLPGRVPGGEAITVRMVLDHTSGLSDYLVTAEGIAAATGQDRHTWTPGELLALAVRQPVAGAPGEQYAYSNTNYVVLGLILERVSHRSIADLLSQRLFRPLGLRDTYFAADGRSRDGRRLAHGYEPDAAHVAAVLPPGAPPGTSFAGPEHDGHADTTAANPSWLWAAGAIVSTPADWQRFLKALVSGRLLPPAQLAQMRTTVAEPAGDGTARYGLGLEQYTSPCGPVWGHTGGVAGYASENYVDDTGRRAVTVVTTTLFGLHEPELGAADRKVVDGAICTMLHQPLPAG